MIISFSRMIMRYRHFDNKIGILDNVASTIITCTNECIHAGFISEKKRKMRQIFSVRTMVCTDLVDALNI